MRTDLINALLQHQQAFGVDLSETAAARLADYYELVEQHNPLLHLTAPCTAEEFAARHILESLALLKYLPEGTGFTDVGTGAGLPSIPCLIVRDDLRAVLIESKPKKAGFLTEALKLLGLSPRAQVVNRQFQETTAGKTEYVTCRALDRFTENLPRLVKWAGGRAMLFFGGPKLEEQLTEMRIRFSKELLPLSEQRYLFQIERNGDIVPINS